MKRKTITKKYKMYEIRDRDTDFLYISVNNYDLAQAFANQYSSFLTKAYIKEIDIVEMEEVLDNE